MASRPAAPFLPQPIYATEDSDPPSVPRVFISPARYVQGEDVLDHLGRYLSLLPSTRPTVLMSAGGRRRHGDRIGAAIAAAGLTPQIETFGGECSTEEIERAARALRTKAAGIDSLIAVGGGKCLDAGKSIARRLGVPMVSCPTIASTDAPCSAVSVIYTEAGVFKDVEFFRENPALVVVDTRVIAEAPLRYLVAGMGDAISTWYEARTCFANPKARTILGTRITLTAATIAELCAKTVFEHGLAAADAVDNNMVTEALERVVEANTLQSGVGFESGGLAVAHAVATAGLTTIPSVHEQYLHGEMVAIGVLAQLAIEDNLDEAKRVAEFFTRVGLPVHLGQLGLDATKDRTAIDQAMAVSAGHPIAHNEPFEVTGASLSRAIMQAHEVGTRVAVAQGKARYQELHAAV